MNAVMLSAFVLLFCALVRAEDVKKGYVGRHDVHGYYQELHLDPHTDDDFKVHENYELYASSVCQPNLPSHDEEWCRDLGTAAQ
eukprot:gene20739-7654_t